MFPDFLSFIQSFILLKIGILAILLLYIILAFVILNQVRVMNNIIKEVFSSSFLFAIALIHFFAAISLFVFALVIL